MKKILKNILIGVGLFIILIALYCAILICSYGLPNYRIRQNLQASVDTIKSENGFYFRPFFGKENPYSDSHTLDNYTDALILGTALDKGEDLGENVVKRAMVNYRYDNNDDGPIISFEKAIQEENYANATYTRYWFGIEAFLRPLLMIFNYQTIRYLNVILIFGLLMTATIMISKKIDLKYAIAFAISISLMGISIIPESLQYSPVMYILLISSIAISVIANSTKFNKLLPFIFLIMGSVTAFMDLLTYPLVTLGIPLILVILIKQKNGERELKNNILLIIELGAIWAISYGATYFVKWALASIVLNQNIIVESINQFLFRANIGDADKINKFSVIYTNFKIYFNAIVLTLLLIYFILWGFMMFKYREKEIKIKDVLPIILIGILPYAWYIVLSNHSNIHSWMTYRIQAITMFSIISITTKMIDFNNIKRKKEA